MEPIQNLEEKEHFLQHELIGHLQRLEENALPSFGRMNARQMVEHLADFIRIANGRTLSDCDAPQVHLDKMRHFLRSEKPFRDNTNNPLLPLVPPPPAYGSLEDAIAEVEIELASFFDIFRQNRDKVITNPIFGDLNYEEQVQLLWKHTRHHLRQFGLMDFAV